MRKILKEEALKILEERQQAGYHIDSRVFKGVRESKNLFILNLEDMKSFLSLIWHDLPGCKLLTPLHKPRTLKDVAQRMISQGLTFEDLTLDLGKTKEEHDQEWFKKCLPLKDKFDFERFGWVILVPANDHEREQNPTGSFYIYDGCGRTLVLSKKLLSNEIEFQSVEAFLILPRPCQ